MSSISHRTAGLLAVHLQFLLIFLPLKFIFILEEESSHVEHVLHVLGHMAATPLISHLAAVDTLATHEHGLNMVFPLLPVILNRNTESSQEELDDGDGVGGEGTAVGGLLAGEDGSAGIKVPVHAPLGKLTTLSVASVVMVDVSKGVSG
jgi:hypothetical protein